MKFSPAVEQQIKKDIWEKGYAILSQYGKSEIIFFMFRYFLRRHIFQFFGFFLPQPTKADYKRQDIENSPQYLRSLFTMISFPLIVITICVLLFVPILVEKIDISQANNFIFMRYIGNFFLILFLSIIFFTIVYDFLNLLKNYYRSHFVITKEGIFYENNFFSSKNFKDFRKLFSQNIDVDYTLYGLEFLDTSQIDDIEVFNQENENLEKISQKSREFPYVVSGSILLIFFVGVSVALENPGTGIYKLLFFMFSFWFFYSFGFKISVFFSKYIFGFLISLYEKIVRKTDQNNFQTLIVNLKNIDEKIFELKKLDENITKNLDFFYQNPGTNINFSLFETASKKIIDLNQSIKKAQKNIPVFQSYKIGMQIFLNSAARYKNLLEKLSSDIKNIENYSTNNDQKLFVKTIQPIKENIFMTTKNLEILEIGKQ